MPNPHPKPFDAKARRDAQESGARMDWITALMQLRSWAETCTLDHRPDDSESWRHMKWLDEAIVAVQACDFMPVIDVCRVQPMPLFEMGRIPTQMSLFQLAVAEATAGVAA